MITTIVNGHVHETPARELGDRERLDLILDLGARGIFVMDAVDVFHHHHLYALEPTSIRQEVIALRAFAARTDARLVWHGAVAS